MALRLASQPWQRINSLAGFPPEVRKQLGFIADPLEDADLGCTRRPGVPTRQLRFGGKANQRYFAYFVQGMGITSARCVYFFECSEDGSAKVVAKTSTGFTKSMRGLMKLIRNSDLELVP
jgi:hypothetical protein